MPDIKDFLMALDGRWRGEEQIASSKWGPGGIAIAELDNRLAFDGTLIQDYASSRDGRPWLQAHAVFVPASAVEAHLFWFDSFGFVPEAAARGALAEDALIVLCSSVRGVTRHTYRRTSEREHTLALESSFDNGESWVPVMSGHYRRML